MLGKRGQFYLIAAIIIVLILYSLAVRVNVFQEQPRFTDFNRIAGNYINEVAGVVNHGVYTRLNSIDIQNLVSEFTQRFLQYARTRDPNIGLVYVYADDSKTIIENDMSGQIVRYDSATEPSGKLFNSDTETINEIGINVGGENFIHDVPVKLKSFSSSYYTTTLSAVDFLKLDIAGVAYTVQPGSSNQFFDVILRTQEEDPSGPGTSTVRVCTYDSGMGVWQCT